MDDVLRQKLVAIDHEYERLTERMSDQEVAANPQEYQKLAKTQSDMQDIVRAFREFVRLDKALQGAREMLREEKDHELRGLAEEERDELVASIEEREQELRILLLPRDPNDDRNTIMEIRAGTGGDEAALFAADLYRMYMRYAETMGWKTEILGSNPTGIGGFKEISFKIAGERVFSHLKWEGGVHRVQRVPATETQGRIHTSAVTVAVLPEADEVDVQIDPTDLQFDVYRSSGSGGQHVNTTDSAVRVTHLPTGLVVTCQDEKSQHKNKARALVVLRARLLAQMIDEENAKRSADRRSQVGSGDRSERIRTYNYPQSRITDHRIGKTMHNLEAFMEGNIGEMVDALSSADRAARLAEV
jgi:peptide chain release factor 1